MVTSSDNPSALNRLACIFLGGSKAHSYSNVLLAMHCLFSGRDEGAGTIGHVIELRADFGLIFNEPAVL